VTAAEHIGRLRLAGYVLAIFGLLLVPLGQGSIVWILLLLVVYQLLLTVIRAYRPTDIREAEDSPDAPRPPVEGATDGLGSGRRRTAGGPAIECHRAAIRTRVWGVRAQHARPPLRVAIARRYPVGYAESVRRSGRAGPGRSATP